MDGRIALLDLPAEMINEICKWLTLEGLLSLRVTSSRYKEFADVIIRLELPKIPLRKILNNDYSHFIYLCSVIKKNPALLNPLKDPRQLLVLCLQLKPIGLLRLSILFSAFEAEVYSPLVEIANSEDDPSWFTAFICCALLTPNIYVLHPLYLDQAIWWLNRPEIKESYAAIIHCLATIKRIFEAQVYIDLRDLPDTLCYLNLQGANLSAGKFQTGNLSYVNLRGATLHDAELQRATLHNSYIKDIDFFSAHHWNTSFFNLADQTATLENQLDMLDYQLRKSELSYRVDESITTDLLTQINELNDPTEKRQALETAKAHHFFTCRQNNPNIQVAFNKAFGDLATPSSTGLFRTTRLRVVQKKPGDFWAPDSSC